MSSTISVSGALHTHADHLPAAVADMKARYEAPLLEIFG